MRLNQRLLGWGVFLAALGGVLVAADLGSLDAAGLVDLLRLWPLAIVAIGLRLVLRRTGLAVPAVVTATALAGVLVGSALAVVPRFAESCGARGEPVAVASTDGMFEAAARVEVRTACGTLDLATLDGRSWRFDAANSAGRRPVIEAGPTSLEIDAIDSTAWNPFDHGRDAWDLELPTSRVDELTVTINAGRGRLDLAGARIDRLDLTGNAAKVSVDAAGADLAEISANVNVGELTLTLPAEANLTGSIRIGAGELRLCVPPGLGLRLTGHGLPDQLGGRFRPGTSTWQSPDYETATHRADLRVNLSFGALEIDPIGGCA